MNHLVRRPKSFSTTTNGWWWNGDGAVGSISWWWWIKLCSLKNRNIKLKREFDDDKRNPWKKVDFKTCWRLTHVDCKLIFEPLQVEMKIGLRHLILSPAGKFCENSRRHINDETIRTIQKRKEWSPDIFLAFWSVFQKYFNSWSILLKWKFSTET